MPIEPSNACHRPRRKWLRSKPAAEYLDVGESTLAKLRCYGGGPPFVKLGNTVIYDVADLDAFVETRKVRNTSEEVGFGERDVSVRPLEPERAVPNAQRPSTGLAGFALPRAGDDR